MSTMRETTDKEVGFWEAEIKAAKKREERYRKTGKRAIEIYECEDEAEIPFNILYSNTETLRPALFSNQPNPVVLRRFKDADPPGKQASEAAQRMLAYHLDTNREGYETFTDATTACTFDALLPGRGVVALKYDADFHQIPEPRPPDESDESPVKEGEASPAEYVSGEQVCYESVVWDRFLTGHAKKWSKVPWIAYAHWMTKEEVAEQFGDRIATKLTYAPAGTEDSPDGRKKEPDQKGEGERKTALIYQIWDKVGGKKIRYYAPDYPDGLLAVEDDPLGLTGFFNTPRPLMFIEKSWSLVPTAPYQMYKQQAEQLNIITRRLTKALQACKVRGVYDGSQSMVLSKIFSGEDNELIPADVSTISEKGFDSLIWMIPLDTLVVVIDRLYQAQGQCKQVIYEITGISDIVRGATAASETATAQELKTQWGTMRLKRMQAEVARYVRDLLRMTLEVAASKFSEETWAGMTGLPFVPTAQREQLAQQMQLFQQLGQKPPPEMQQALQQPVWGQVLALLKDDQMRAYKIDIETNSTIQPDETEDREQISQVLAMLGQFLQGVGPLVQQKTMPFQVAQSMLLAVSRRFRFGRELEDAIQSMQEPQPPDDGQAQAAQAQAAKMQQQMAEQQMALKQAQAEATIQKAAMAAELKQTQAEHDLQIREMKLAIEENQFKLQVKAESDTLAMKQQRAKEELDTRLKQSDLDRKVNSMKNGKATQDAALGKLEQALAQVTTLEASLQQVQEQAEATQQLLTKLIQVTSAKRIRRPIRGEDGSIERVEEEMERVT